MKHIWMYNGAYRLAAEGKLDEQSIWYVTDEVGTSLCHSDQPNCKLLPFIYSPQNKLEDDTTITYSILWPVQDLAENSILSRDFLYNIDEKKFRSSRLSVWYNTPPEYFKEQIRIFREGSQGLQGADELHAQLQQKHEPVDNIRKIIGEERKIKVWTDYLVISDNLDKEVYEITEDAN